MNDQGTVLPMLLFLFVWGGVIYLVIRSTKNWSIGLPFAYVLVMTFNHMGGFAYAVPGYTQDRIGAEQYIVLRGYDATGTLLGTFASLIGLVGFLVGVHLVGAKSRISRGKLEHRTAHSLIGTNRNERKLVLFGLASLVSLSIAINHFGISVPAQGAILAAGRNAIPVLVSAGIYFSLLSGSGHIWLWLLVGAFFSLSSIASGYAAYGFINAAMMGSFLLRMVVPKRRADRRDLVLSLIGLYVTAAVFVAYYSFRESLRANSFNSLWERLYYTLSQLGEVKWLNPFDFSSLDWLNMRLNQSWWIGEMIQWHDRFPSLREFGGTLYPAIFSWVPRFIWTSKPELGGSTFVSRHTGLDLAEHATFLGGQVFEGYVNFGYLGVFGLMIIYGAVIRRIDLAAHKSLQHGRYRSFALFFIAGIAMLQALQDFFFIVNTAVTSVIILWGILYILRALGVFASAPRQVKSHGVR